MIYLIRVSINFSKSLLLDFLIVHQGYIVGENPGNRISRNSMILKLALDSIDNYSNKLLA